MSQEEAPGDGAWLSSLAALPGAIRWVCVSVAVRSLRSVLGEGSTVSVGSAWSHTREGAWAEGQVVPTSSCVLFSLEKQLVPPEDGSRTLWPGTSSRGWK